MCIRDSAILEAVLQRLRLFNTLAVGEANRIHGLAIFHQAQDGVGTFLTVSEFIAEATAVANINHDAHREAGDRIEPVSYTHLLKMTPVAL